MTNFGFGFPFKSALFGGGFNPLTDIDGLSLYLNKNTNVNTKIAADFVSANAEYLSSASTDFNATTSFSTGLWFKVDVMPTSGNHRLIGKDEAANRQYGLFLQSTDDTVNWFCKQTDTTLKFIEEPTTLVINTWYFVACVFDDVNNLIKISLNGGAFETVACDSVISSVANFAIGSGWDYTAGFSMDGSIDAPFFYGKALSLAEKNALYNLGNGVSYPSLEDLNGNTYAIGQALSGAEAFNIDSVLTPLASTTTGEWEVYYTPTLTAPPVTEAIISFGDTDAIEILALHQLGTSGILRMVFSITSTQFDLRTTANPFTSGVQSKINVIQDGVEIILKVDDVKVAQSFTTGTGKQKWFNDATGLDNGRIGCWNYNSGGDVLFANAKVQNIKIWNDDVRTTQVADYLLNNVEGASQVDTIGAYNGTPIGTPVSTLASVDNTTIATIESSLVLWADLNEESGTRFDSSGNGNDLTDNNSVLFSLGKVQDSTVGGSRATSLDGSTDALNVDTLVGDLATTTTGIWAGWVKPVDATPVGREYIISLGDADANTLISINIETDGTCRALAVNSGVVEWVVKTDAIAFSDATWTHVALLQNGTEGEIYINGSKPAQTFSVSVDKTIWINDTIGIDTYRLGCLNYNSGGNSAFANIDMDEFGFWSNDSSVTIASLYNSGNGKALSDLTTAEKVGLVGYYSLDGLLDSSGNSNDLVAIGTPTPTEGILRYPERVWNWIDQSSNQYIFNQDVATKMPLLDNGGYVAFDGVDDSLDKTIANVYSGDSSGIIFFSGYYNAFDIVLATADSSVNTHTLYLGVNPSGKIFISTNDGTTNNGVSSTTVISGGAFYYGYIKSTGTAWEINLNGAIETVIITVGSNNGTWFSDIANRDSLTVGSQQRLAAQYGSSKANKVIYSNAALSASKIAQINTFMSNPNN